MLPRSGVVLLLCMASVLPRRIPAARVTAGKQQAALEFERDIRRQELTPSIDEICSGTQIKGIANSGVDCFLNSMMQVVMNSPPVCRAVFNEDNILKADEDPIACLRPFIGKYMNSSITSSDTSVFRRCLDQQAMVSVRTNTQEDASEAFVMLLSKYKLSALESEGVLSHRREFRRFCREEVTDLQATSGGFTVLQSKACAGDSGPAVCDTAGVLNPSPLLGVPLDSDGQEHSLSYLYSEDLSAVLQDDANNEIKVHLPADGKDGADEDGRVQEYLFMKAEESPTPPRELIVGVQRFTVDYSTWPPRTEKLLTKVNVPLAWKHPANKQCYDLVGLVVHWGSDASAGHYTSYRHVDGQWFHVNDAVISPQTVENVQEAAREALILQYRIGGTSCGSAEESLSPMDYPKEGAHLSCWSPPRPEATTTESAEATTTKEGAVATTTEKAAAATTKTPAKGTHPDGGSPEGTHSDGSTAASGSSDGTPSDGSKAASGSSEGTPSDGSRAASGSSEGTPSDEDESKAAASSVASMLLLSAIAFSAMTV